MSEQVQGLIQKYTEELQSCTEWPEASSPGEVQCIFENVLKDLQDIADAKEEKEDPFIQSAEVRKLTDQDLLQEIIGFILDKESNMTLKKIYRTRHSPMRSQLFLVKAHVYSEVSVHLVRHNAHGQFHYVSSNRYDWNGEDESYSKKIHRLTPVRHVMILNAQHLLEIAGERLCTKALPNTRDFVRLLRDKIYEIDPDLADRMRPKCFQQGGVCYEDEPCGQNLLMLRQIVEQVPEGLYRDWRNEDIIAGEGK